MAHCEKCNKFYDWCECEEIMNLNTAIEMAEDLTDWHEDTITILGDYDVEVCRLLLKEIYDLRHDKGLLIEDCQSLRNELYKQNGVIR